MSGLCLDYIGEGGGEKGSRTREKNKKERIGVARYT